MTIHPFGTVKGEHIDEIRLSSAAGATASILTWGATLRDLVVPLPNAKQRRVVLGYEDMEGYAVNPNYLGATVGRYANRIAEGRFSLDGIRHEVGINENGITHLHGGQTGFSRRNWTITEHDESSVTLKLISENGDQSFPGRVEAFCRYELMDPATLRIVMTAQTDAPTLVNMANHGYFTLNEGANCGEHSLWIDADHYTPVDERLIPTGEILSVAGTPFDFRQPKRIAESGVAYDVNYALNPSTAPLAVCARVEAPDKTVRLEIATTEPGLQLYTGVGLRQLAPGIDGQVHRPYGGFCLETQRFPDAPNRRHFPSAVLRPGETYRNVVEYRFMV